jgi:hypothetical protein
MKVDAQPIWESSLPGHALNSLSLNNERIIAGSDEILINPAFSEISDEEIFEGAEDILSQLRLTSQLRKIEDANRDKFGPRSLAKNWESRKADLYDYFNHKDFDPGSIKCSGRLRPVSAKTVSDKLLKSSSAGLPYMRRKGLVLKDALREQKEQLGVYPCVLFTRTQENKKTRNVWGYPVSDTIEEQRYFLPHLELEKTLNYRSALLGPNYVDQELTNLLFTKSNDEVVYCVDFSAYDASVSPEYSYKAFSTIASRFQPSNEDELYLQFRRFTNIGVYTPDGEISGPHGIPSGSSFTNTVGSLVQYQVTEGKYKCQIQGDDGIYIVPRGDRDLFTQAFKAAGLVLNESKSDVFEDQQAIFLQRYYSPEYRTKDGGLGGVYSIYRALARIKYLERWTDFKAMDIDGADFFALRTIIILENCKHHPGFELLIKYVQSLDKYSLEFSKQGLLAFSRAMEAKTRAGVFNQYGLQKGITNFETMKLLKQL